MDVAVYFCLQAEDGIRDLVRSRGLGDVYKRQGYGHDAAVWRDIVSALRLVGYDYVVSIEHEDALMSTDEGLAKGIALLQEVTMFEQPGEMFWA